MNTVNGVIQFNITVRPFEFRDWSPARITEFFQGIAEIIYAAGPQNTNIEVK